MIARKLVGLAALFSVLAATLIGCAPSQPEVVSEPVVVEQTVEVPQTVIVEQTVEGEEIVEDTPTAEPVEISVWTEFTAPPRTTAVDEWIAGFEEEYPWISVEHRGISNENYNDVLRTAMLGGQPPDLFVTGTRAHLTDYEDADLLYDLTDWYAEYGDRFIPGYELNSVIGGVRYAVPWTILVLDLIWYNPQITGKYGLNPQDIETFEDLLAMCETLKDNGEVCFAFGGGGAGWKGGHWVMLLIQNNMPEEEWLKLATREKKWTDEDVVRLLSYFEKLVEEGYVAPGAAADERDAGLAVHFQGEGAFWQAGSWHLYQKGGDMAPPDWEFEFIPFPPLADSPDLNVAVSGSNLQWTIANESDHIDETLLFLEYISRLENVERWVELTQAFVAVQGAVNEKTAEPEMARIANYVESSNVQTLLEHYMPVAVRDEAHWVGAQGVLSGQINTEEWAELIESTHDAEGALPLD
ncbi:MAG: ABC transporter substrate-binding protein [bacterium]